MQQGSSRLAGKVAIVTGAGPSDSGPRVGTGRAISIRLAREGAKVVLVDLEASRAEDTLKAIREEGGEASVFAGDVTKSDDCRRIAEAARERYGGLDILVNNVGILLDRSTVVDVEEEAWDRMLRVNLKSMMLTGKHAVPIMAETGGGAIINISSDGALRAGPRSQVHYNTAKGGVIALTMTMAAHHGRENIRVNCIAPGSINTPMLASVTSDEGRIRSNRLTPLGTEGTAWDIAWATVFLASDEARWITGVVLPVDAGGLITSATGNAPEDV